MVEPWNRPQEQVKTAVWVPGVDGKVQYKSTPFTIMLLMPDLDPQNRRIKIFYSKNIYFLFIRYLSLNNHVTFLGAASGSTKDQTCTLRRNIFCKFYWLSIIQKATTKPEYAFFHSTPLQPQISQDNNKGELIRSNQSPSRKTPMMLVYEAVALGTGLTDSLWLQSRERQL